MTTDPADDARARSARRRAARAHHPDLGGDVDAFIAAMAATGPGSHPPYDGADQPRVEVVRTTRGRLALVVHRHRRLVVTQLRGRLPRSFPGSRRFGRL